MRDTALETAPIRDSRGHNGGLYDPAREHDGCGVAFVARLNGEKGRDVVERALEAIENLEHRGASGADVHTGDGAGILVQLPDAFFRAVLDAELPFAGRYGVAMCFLPQDAARRYEIERLMERVVAESGQRVIAWRDVPVRSRHAGVRARQVAPRVRQLFIGAAVGETAPSFDSDDFERRLYVIRRRIELAAGEDVSIVSLSARTIVYKGMLAAPQVRRYYADVEDPRFESALALVHSRFSTNTFPSWPLAHPYRMIAHNGEVNTRMGNVNWMRARESQLASHLFGPELAEVLPVVQPGGSDSLNFDNVLELLVLGGRSLPHALMMMVPQPFEGRDDLPQEVKDFYAYHGAFMEAWDGPAAIAFTDGRTIGATLDRNGLRPGRWATTKDGYVVLASEAGVLDIPPEQVERKGRLQPGQLFVVDLERGGIVEDAEAKHEVASRRPYGEWVAKHSVRLADLPQADPLPSAHPVRPRQLAFGYTQEDLGVLLAPMAATGEEPTGSMGNDNALAVLSDRQPPLFSYFKQLFAQVTNPAIDPIRESIVMSLSSGVGGEGNLLAEEPAHARQIVLDGPILRNDEMAQLHLLSRERFSACAIDITWAREEGPDGLAPAVERLCRHAEHAVDRGANVLILSDRAMGPDRVPVPSLLAVAAVHHHLVRGGKRLRAGLVIESGEPREVHHMACLIGFGASAVNPYLMFETLDDLCEHGELPGGKGIEEAREAVVKAIGKGLLKTISKMGISTIQSYCGAQIFEAVGLARPVIDRYFTGTASRIGGVGLDVLAQEAIDRHGRAYPRETHDLLPVGGIYAWRRDGEAHAWNPETVPALQRAANGGGREAYAEYARAMNDDSARRATLRGLLQLRRDQQPVPLDEVEPAKEIVKRFCTGAMSLGSISPEAHETLAIAMNRLGGKSNTGEGGEDERRYTPDPNGDSRRSSIKQVASARFGVTVNYLVNADELQIKVSQGAKPGEGGQLPGHKVNDYIGRLRHSTPGVALISPPPHHDIYSIEDLKQLIYDLRCANPSARISVKLVAEVGVGTVAAGVAKAGADHVVIAGHDGGTGASPLSSIQAAGVPWEIGLAETQQTLLRNDLRGRIAVQADGQMRTGRDVVIAALLGAEEVGFSTAPLITLGCIMMRVCHLNTCPVGVATQDPVLRRRFRGTPEAVVNYFFMVAEEARELMAGLGIRRFEDLVGRVELLEMDSTIQHWKAHGVDLAAVLSVPPVDPAAPRHQVESPPPALDDAIDHELIAAAEPAIERGEAVLLQRPVRNVNRTVGGMLSGEISRRLGPAGLPEGSIEVRFKGAAGQSFGAWLAPGVSFSLSGEANDYTGKGLSGGVLAVFPPAGTSFRAEENVIVGNTVLYGATSGRAFFRGLAGERFAVRNSGALAVVEGVGDHGCEYMTGGRVVVLGPTGRNFAAGMSGGIAYVLDARGTFASRANTQLVDLMQVEDPAEALELQDLVAEHAARTGSSLAERLLARWDRALPRFVKVMPRDYARVLAERAEAAGEAAEERDERDEREAVLA